MKNNIMITLITALTLMACGDEKGQAGDSCTTDDDCEEGLECHVEEHDDHDDHDEEEEGHDEEGVCEEADEHDGHDH